MKTLLIALCALALPAAGWAASNRNYSKTPTKRFVSGSRGPSKPASVPRAQSRPQAGGSHGLAGVTQNLWGSNNRSQGSSSRGAIQRRGFNAEQQSPSAVEGAMIRTEGFGYKTAPTTPEGRHEVDGGNGMIAMDGNGQLINNSPGIRQGPKDKLPPPNPTSGSGSATGRNAITENAP